MHKITLDTIQPLEIADILHCDHCPNPGDESVLGVENPVIINVDFVIF